MATEKKQSFLGGAAVLAFGIVAVKIIGAVFKIPLRNILGEGGSADFSNAYNIYATMLTISTAGLPVALSKLVSEAYARGRTRQAQRTFHISLIVFLVLGVLSFALMWWGNEYLAGLLNNPRAAYGILAGHLGNTMSVAGGIVVGAIVYAILVLVLRIVSKDDLSLMPKGDKIAKLLHIK